MHAEKLRKKQARLMVRNIVISSSRISDLKLRVTSGCGPFIPFKCIRTQKHEHIMYCT